MLTKESLLIENNYKKYPFRLECNDITGFIRMTKNTQKVSTRITRRNIPISDQQHWLFYKQRTGWYDRSKGDPFTGSYLNKKINPETYDKWLHFMYNIYKEYKNKEK